MPALKKIVLQKKIMEDIAFHEKQTRLKEKYSVQEDVVIVEKNNTIKYLLKFIDMLFRKLSAVMLLVLACIGTLGVLLPAPRTELIQTLQELYLQLLNLLP